MPVATDVYVVILAHQSSATGKAQDYPEGLRLLGNHADVIANESYYAVDGTDLEVIAKARAALLASIGS